MLSGKFVSYKTIVNDVLRDFPFVINNFTDEECLSALLSMVKLAGEPMAFNNENLFVKIEQGKAELPNSFYKIESIFKSNKDTIEDAKCETSDARPMRYATGTLHRTGNTITSSKFNAFHNYTYKLDNNYIFTNFETGVVILVVKQVVTDEEGFPMLPLNESWQQAGIHEIAWRCARKLWYSDKFANDKFAKIEGDRDWYFAQAVNSSRIPSLDKRESQKNYNIASIKDPFLHETAFEYMQKPEYRSFQGNYNNNNYVK